METLFNVNDFNNWVSEFNNRISVQVLREGRLGELLAGLGFSLQIRPGQTTYHAACPLHGGGPNDFFLRANGHTVPVLWWCRRRCDKTYISSLTGLVRGLLSRRQGRTVSLGKAVDYLQCFLGVSLTQARTREEIRARLVIPSPYFAGRGLSSAVLDVLDIGHCPVRRKTIVPLYDDGGEIVVGRLARSEQPFCDQCERCHAGPDCHYGELRWMFSEGFPRRNILYHYAAAARSEGPFVVLVEGVPEVVRAVEVGIPTVAAFGTELTSAQADKLAMLQKRVVVAYDNDEAGRQHAPAVAGQLRAMGVSAEVCFPPSGYKDLADVPAAEARAWLEQVRRSGSAAG